VVLVIDLATGHFCREHLSVRVETMPFTETRWRLGTAVAIVTLVGAWAVLAQTQADPLLQGFQSPPGSAKPRVWWHWNFGNVTKEGIKADLEWMNRVGIGGFQTFDASISTPQIVDKRLIFMTPEWKDAFRYTTTLADQLGLEMAIAGSPGWSESGGPWVTPALAMKKYVWSETRIAGGQPLTGRLPQPPDNAGPYQNTTGGGRGEPAGPPPKFYADSGVIAFPVSENDRTMAERGAKVTSSGGTFNPAALTDGDLAKTTLLPAVPPGEKAWIQYELPTPQTFGGLTLITGGGGGGRGFGGRGGGASGMELVSSDDGQSFQSVVMIPGGARTVAFPPVTARFFRITVGGQQPQQGRGGGGGGFPGAGGGFPGGGGGFPGGGFPPPQGGRAGQFAAPTGTEIAEFVLHSAVVNRFQDKAGFSAATGIYAMATPNVPATAIVRKANVVDLTGKMRPDGTLDWTPPAGPWVVIRMGYSLTGAHNDPAAPEATGLEVDKMNRASVKTYFDYYLDKYKDASGGLMGKRGVQYMITDSWEAGVANWTNEMFAEFARRRGYDMHPWLPVLFGYVVESAESSDRFLWDFRKTISDLTGEYHYDQLTSILKDRGMARYSESHENGRAFVAEGMDVKRTAAVPMSAMWAGRGGVNGEAPNYNGDIRESASVAHIYGQNLVAAESFTAAGGAYTYNPETLKPTADAELAMGLNRFVIHTSVHQPGTKPPGISLGQFGQWFTRLETWAELAKPWTTYLARSSYMLQQGKFAADVLYYYGEDSNITALFGNTTPSIPSGYDYDFASSDVVLNRVTVKAGRLTTATGMSYRVLAIDPNAQYMTLPVLRKIRDLVNSGAAIAGPKPVNTPSLSDDQKEFKRIADQLWGTADGEHRVGQGKVFAGQTVAQALSALQVAPDVEYSKPQSDTTLLFVHRRLPDGEVYWVGNRKNRAEMLDVTFRVEGKSPEVWHADTGKTAPASYRIAGGRTTVPLQLEPSDAVFVVFRKAANAPTRVVAKEKETDVAPVDGSWDVAFQPNRGAPAQITLEKLTSWHENTEAGIKYFSGTATYTKTLQASANWFGDGAHLVLDLGSVKNIAEVAVNGKSLGIAWKPPFRVDVTGALKPGPNTLQVKVTNLWVNRVVGDLQPGAGEKYTYTSYPYYRPDSPLLPSGLLGPVKVVRLSN
jgi:hypothetical protein